MCKKLELFPSKFYTDATLVGKFSEFEDPLIAKFTLLLFILRVNIVACDHSMDE